MCRTRIAHGDGVDGGAAQNHAKLCQASAKHFQQRAEFVPLRNRDLRALAVTVLPIPLARRAAATACGAPRGKMVSRKEATGIPGTSRSRLGKLARTKVVRFISNTQNEKMPRNRGRDLEQFSDLKVLPTVGSPHAHPTIAVK
jgi:hypothetical protein